MPRLFLSLVVLATLLLVYCYWGLFTIPGQRAYPEMAGLIPFYGGILGAVLIGIAAVAAVVMRWRRRPATGSGRSRAESERR